MIYQNNFGKFLKILLRLSRANYEEEQKIWREEKLRVFY